MLTPRALGHDQGMPDETVVPPEADPRGDPGPAEDPVEIPLPPPADDALRCQWCSALLDAPDAATCPSCGAHLVEPSALEIPGVTAVDPEVIARANRPRTPRRSIGSILMGDDAMEIPPPTQAELPALAPPDAAVRREIRRLELEALGLVAPDGPAAPANHVEPAKAGVEPDTELPGTGPAVETDPPDDRSAG